MKIIGFILKYVVINVFIMALFVIGGISLMTGQFPPKMSTIKDYTSKVANFSDTYKTMLNSSNKAIQQQLGDEMALAEQIEKNSQPKIAVYNEAGSGTAIETVSQTDEVRALNSKLQALSLEINRLQNENHALRTRLMAK